MCQAVELIADERCQDPQRNGKHPTQASQQTHNERQLDCAVHKQVSSGKMLGARSQVLRHAYRMGGKKISGIFGQLLAGQPCNHVPDLGPYSREQGDGPDQLDATVRTLENHACQKGAVCETVDLYHEP